MTPPAPARVFGFVAAEAHVCVLLRRGPSKRVLMVRWDLATDEFEIGQWLFARVYENECDLSPDGKFFAYQALDGKWQSITNGVYTAISRPPYFTALSLWAQGTTYERGMRWSRSAISFLRSKPPVPTQGSLPSRYATLLREADSTISAIDRNWSVKGFSHAELVRDTVVGQLLWHVNRNHWPGPYYLQGQRFNAQWADVDHRGRLLLAREGRIFVRDTGSERELIDLNPFEFRPLAPPKWATEWP